ncbi:MAG: hypothetical protein ABOK23_07725 [Candidatus Methanoperedens sp.]|nr:hypothetical protein [Candidatus Methanoperedens sp.]
MEYMQKDRLVLIFPHKDTSTLKHMFPKDNLTPWVYLGQNFSKKHCLEKELGSSFRYVDITRLHDQVARDLRHEYVRWIDNLNEQYGNNLEWWFGSISSRNPYISSIFQYCCYLEILERLWTDKDKRPGLIIVESVGLAEAIRKWSSNKNIEIKIIQYNYARLKSFISNSFFFLRWGNFFVVLLLRWVTAYTTRKKYYSNKHNENPSVIVSTFLHDYCLSDDGAFKDRYFPHLHEYLSEKGMITIVHPVLSGFGYNYFSIYRKMRKSNTRFIVQEDFLHFSDYLCALIYPLKVIRQEIKPVLFHNFNIYDILKEEKKQNSITCGMEAVLIYHLFLRLGKSELSPKIIIDWYENHVIDKALIIGARKVFPKAKIIGAQIFVASHNFISVFPSQSEVDAHIVPDLLLETSKYRCQIAQSFTKDIPCKSAAALRYSHIFSDESISNQSLDQKSQKILVLLPGIIDEAVELLVTLKEVLEQTSDEIMIKGHPDYTPEELRRAFGEGEWPDRFEIFNGALPDALNRASVVISSNSSSMVEAAAKGIPVIFLGRQTVLNNNILSDLNMDIVTECFSVPELVKAIDKYLNISPNEKIIYKEMGRKVRDLFFEPVNEDTLLPFLGIEKDIKCKPEY